MQRNLTESLDERNNIRFERDVPMDMILINLGTVRGNVITDDLAWKIYTLKIFYMFSEPSFFFEADADGNLNIIARVVKPSDTKSHQLYQLEAGKALSPNDVSDILKGVNIAPIHETASGDTMQALPLNNSQSQGAMVFKVDLNTQNDGFSFSNATSASSRSPFSSLISEYRASAIKNRPSGQTTMSPGMIANESDVASQIQSEREQTESPRFNEIITKQESEAEHAINVVGVRQCSSGELSLSDRQQDGTVKFSVKTDRMLKESEQQQQQQQQLVPTDRVTAKFGAKADLKLKGI